MAVFVAVDGATGKITGSHSSKKPVLPQLMAVQGTHSFAISHVGKL
jgi:hypothetical protein